MSLAAGRACPAYPPRPAGVQWFARGVSPARDAGRGLAAPGTSTVPGTSQHHIMRRAAHEASRYDDHWIDRVGGFRGVGLGRTSLTAGHGEWWLASGLSQQRR